MAALEAETISWEKRIVDSGEYYVEGDDRPYKGWKEGGHGNVDMKKAIIESSDVYFYALAYDLTINNLSPFLEKFGYGKQSGLTENEAKGILPSRKWKLGYIGEAWFKGDTINMGIGQGYITATPIQIALAYATLANRGEIVKPRIIEKIGGVSTEKVSNSNISLNDNQNWKRIEEALLGVVEASNGTANNIYDRNIRIAGKTGTAQVKSIGETEYKFLREDESLRDHALFVGYGPVEDPKLVVVAIIENGESGSTVAAPLVRKAINLYSKMKNNLLSFSVNLKIDKISSNTPQFDYWILFSVIFLCFFGLAMIYSSSNSLEMTIRQGTYFFLGLLGMLLLAFSNFRKKWKSFICIVFGLLFFF